MNIKTKIDEITGLLKWRLEHEHGLVRIGQSGSSPVLVWEPRRRLLADSRG